MRLPDWPQRLTAVIVASRGRAVRYGEHDCCLFAADCVLALTGVDVAAAWRGDAYADIGEGLALARARSVSHLAGRFFAPVAPAMAWRGDLAAVRIGRRLGLMVFDGGVLRGAAGSVARRGAAVRAWRVE